MPAETAVSEVPPHVLDFLRGQMALTLATSSAAGVPLATTLTYVNDGLAIYVWTRPESTVARQVDENPVVSLAVGEYVPDWRRTQGIQGVGECQVVLNPAEIARVRQAFAEKYPDLSSAFASASFFRITPTELQFIDNAGVSDAERVEYRHELVYSVFRDLPEQAVATMAAKLQTVEVEAGDVIVRQGGPADKFFIIVDGEVEVVREDDGTTRTLTHLVRGQFFGELAILRDMPRTATVRAVTPTTLLSMERDTFRSLVAQSLGATEDFDRVIQERLLRTAARENR